MLIKDSTSECILKISSLSYVMFARLSFCPHRTTRHPLDGFSSNFLFEDFSKTASGAHPIGSLSQAQSGRGGASTNVPHLAPRLKTGKRYDPNHPPCVFLACYRVKFTLTTTALVIELDRYLDEFKYSVLRKKPYQ